MLSTPQKLAILADAAKYDVSCASSGAHEARLARQGRARLHDRHGHLPFLHAGRPLRVAAEDPADQLLHLRLRLLHQPPLLECARGRASASTRSSTSRSPSTGATTSRACSSPPASSSPPTTRWSSWSRSRGALREEHHFRGYIHLKTIPEASAGADRRGRPLCRPAVDQHRAADARRALKALRARRRRRPRSSDRWRRCGSASTRRSRRSERGKRGAALRAGRAEHADDRRRRRRERRDDPRHLAPRSMPATA